MNFYIFRHGETLETKNKFEYDRKRIRSAPILEEAKPKIRKIAKYLKNIETDYNVSSPFLRCRQTVEIVEKISNKKFEFDKRVGEYLLVIGEENHDEFVARVKSFLKDIKMAKYRNIAICTHGAVVSALKHIVLEGEFAENQLHNYPPPGVLLIIKDGKEQEVDFN